MKSKMILVILLLMSLVALGGCQKNNNTTLVTIEVAASPAEGGTVSKNRDVYRYEDGVILIATPKDGYMFKGWSENGTNLDITDAEYRFRATVDRTLTATFVPSFDLTVSITPEGAGKITSENQYEANTDVTVKADANYGYRFVRWTDKDGSEVSQAEEYTFQISADTLLTAVFEKTPTSATSEIISFVIVTGIIVGGIFLALSLRKRRAKSQPTGK